MTYVLIDDRVINLMAIATIRKFEPVGNEHPFVVEIYMITGHVIRYSDDKARTVWNHLSKTATPLEVF